MISIRTTTGLKRIAAVRIRTSTGLKGVASVKIRTSTELREIYNQAPPGGAFEVNAIPLSPFGGAASNAAVTITTEVVSVTASGGVAPYTFAFRQTDAEPSWSISVVGDGQARFSRINVGPADSWTASFACEVTDGAGRKVDSQPITASVTNYGGFSL